MLYTLFCSGGSDLDKSPIHVVLEVQAVVQEETKLVIEISKILCIVVSHPC
jgi:hypothetical protein